MSGNLKEIGAVPGSLVRLVGYGSSLYSRYDPDTDRYFGAPRHLVELKYVALVIARVTPGTFLILCRDELIFVRIWGQYDLDSRWEPVGA